MPWLMAVLLVLGRPLDFAVELLHSLPSLAMRGPAAVIELIFHATVAVTAIAAARALWSESPVAPRLAAIAVIASAITRVQSLYWSALPRQTQPGDIPLLAAVTVAHAIFWLTYLATSRRIRDFAR